MINHPDKKPSRKLLWCDAEANCNRMSTRAEVALIAEKASRAGIDTLIVDVKPLSGEVLYCSRYAPRLGEVEGYRYPESFDLLSAMIEEGHARGLEVHAAINVFSEGHRAWERGPAYDHPEWQVVMHEAARTLTLGSHSFYVEFVDPWESQDAPVAYTSRSGSIVSPEPGKQYIVITDQTVTDVHHEPSNEIPIPRNGCVVAIPSSDDDLEINPGDTATWRAHPKYCSSAESRIPSFGIFVNPIGPARPHELNIIREIVSNYEIDGIVFDRMRYPNLHGDFSPTSRKAFETWLGNEEVDWPGDIFTISAEPWLPPSPGRYYKEWLEWRAWQIRYFAGEAIELSRSLRQGVSVGVYVGSWYESYFDVGVNWGSKDFHAGYWWMTPGYNETGYAELFDFVCTGCYYPSPTRKDALASGRPEGACVEAACEISRQAIGDASSIYGSLYLREYAGKPEVFSHAVETALHGSEGVMLFDLVYLEDYGWWPIIEELFRNDTTVSEDRHDQP